MCVFYKMFTNRLTFSKNDFILFEIYTKAAIKIDLILMTAITNLYAFVLYMRYKKYGAPIMATTIPAGTPDGCKMTFPNVSENTSKMHQLKSL